MYMERVDAQAEATITRREAKFFSQQKRSMTQDGNGIQNKRELAFRYWKWFEFAGSIGGTVDVE